MLNKKVVIVFLILLLCNFEVYALDPIISPGGSQVDVGKIDPTSEDYNSEYAKNFFSQQGNIQSYPDNFKKYMKEEHGIDLTGDLTGASYNGNTLTYSDGTNIKLEDFQDKGYTVSSDGTKVTVKDETGKEVNIVGGANVHLDEDDVLTVDSVDSLQVGTTTITNGINVKIYENKITADHADSFIRDNSVSANVDNLESIPEVFSVEKADFVMSGCVRADNVIDSTFRIDDSSLEVIAGEGILVNITDCNSNNVGFDSDGGTISVTKTTPAEYTITKGNLTFNSASFSEKIATNSTAMATLELNEGFSCMTLFPVSTYYYFDENILKDYAVHVPEYGDEYRLCIRKDEIQHFTDYDGIADMPEKSIELNKIVNYLRYQFDESGNLIDLIMKESYEGKSNQIKMTASLDEDFIFLNSLNIDKISNDPIQCNNEEIISETHNLNYHVIEICNPELNRVKRYLGFEHDNPGVIKQYNSNFGVGRSPILFENKILIVKNEITESRLFSSDVAKDYYKEEMDEYKSKIDCSNYFNSLFEEDAGKTIYNWYLG